jgi:hypothetical protein
MGVIVQTIGGADVAGWSQCVRTLAKADRVGEHRSGVLAWADAMFRSALTPCCTTWF